MPLNINWQQILLHLFNFLLLFALLYYLLYEPVVKFMQKREDYYKDMDENANKNLQESQKLLAENKAKMENADSDIKKYRDEKFDEVSVQIKEKLDQAKEEEERIISDARSKAQLEYDKIIEGANKDIKQMALTATKKILGDKDKDSIDNFIESSLKEGK